MNEYKILRYMRSEIQAEYDHHRSLDQLILNVLNFLFCILWTTRYDVAFRRNALDIAISRMDSTNHTINWNIQSSLSSSLDHRSSYCLPWIFFGVRMDMFLPHDDGFCDTKKQRLTLEEINAVDILHLNNIMYVVTYWRQEYAYRYTVPTHIFFHIF